MAKLILLTLGGDIVTSEVDSHPDKPGVNTKPAKQVFLVRYNDYQSKNTWIIKIKVSGQKFEAISKPVNLKKLNATLDSLGAIRKCVGIEINKNAI